MKYLLIMLFSTLLLQAQNFGILIPQEAEFGDIQTLQKDIEALMANQNLYQETPDKMEIYIDQGSELLRRSQVEGTDLLVELAQMKGWFSIAIVEYKRAFKSIHIRLVSANKSQDRKSVTLKYTPQKSENLAAIIFTQTLGLNYQLGNYNAKTLY